MGVKLETDQSHLHSQGRHVASLVQARVLYSVVHMTQVDKVHPSMHARVTLSV